MYKKAFHTKDISKTNFLITGGAGFIGSNLVEYLIKHGAGGIVILDNLSTGYIDNITPFLNSTNVKFIQGDIRNVQTCIEATQNIDIVLHTAALGSVPRSIKDPLTTHEVNATGFINLLWACKQNGVKRVVFSSSSSIYGLNKNLPLKESYFPQPISPYAVSKYSNEQYADVFEKSYGLEYIGLRYFNVFGPKQNVNGPYAAVIPNFISKLIDETPPTINGDGTTSRDFTYIENVVQANIKSALIDDKKSINRIYNISAGRSISLNELYAIISEELNIEIPAIYGKERLGDIKDSLADISEAKLHLKYIPTILVEEGLKATVQWFKSNLLLVKS